MFSENSGYDLEDPKVPLGEKLRSLFGAEQNRALVLAIYAGKSSEQVLTMVGSAGDVNAPVKVDGEWETPLESALRCPAIDLGVVGALLGRGAEITPDALYRVAARFQDAYMAQAALPPQFDPSSGSKSAAQRGEVESTWQSIQSLAQMLSRRGADWSVAVTSSHTAREMIEQCLAQQDKPLLASLGIESGHRPSRRFR